MTVYRSPLTPWTSSAVAIALVGGCLGDVEHPSFDHRCDTWKDEPAWQDKNLSLHHNEPRTCPVKVSSPGQQVVFTATTIQQPITDPADEALVSSGEVRDPNNQLVSAQFAEAFFEDPGTGNWKATISGYYYAGRTAVALGDVGTDVGHVQVTCRSSPYAYGRVYLEFKIGNVLASIAGQAEVPPFSGCQFVGSVANETIVQWQWFVNYELAGDGQTFVLRSGNTGEQYAVQVIARDADGYDHDGWIYPTVTETAPSGECGW